VYGFRKSPASGAGIEKGPDHGRVKTVTENRVKIGQRGLARFAETGLSACGNWVSTAIRRRLPLSPQQAGFLHHDSVEAQFRRRNSGRQPGRTGPRDQNIAIMQNSRIGHGLSFASGFA
jgi:hypothetical protein